MFRTTPIFGMSRDHYRTCLKTQNEWIVFDRFRVAKTRHYLQLVACVWGNVQYFENYRSLRGYKSTYRSIIFEILYITRYVVFVMKSDKRLHWNKKMCISQIWRPKKKNPEAFRKVVNEVLGIRSALQFLMNFNAHLIHGLSQFSLIYYECDNAWLFLGACARNQWDLLSC